MHRGFNFTVSADRFQEHVAHGRTLYKVNFANLEAGLASFMGPSGKLQASTMTGTWFPKIDADVFISHAHKDEDLAIGLSGYLEAKFGIRSFIDSTAWGHCNELIKKLDVEFCQIPGKNTYDYDLRNLSTAYVHMMLATALQQMIDQCECLIFLNTPSSMTSSEAVNEKTGSPWIYAELAMSRLVRQRRLDDYRSSMSKMATESSAVSAMVEFDADLDHLVPMTETKFNLWADAANDTKRYDALDLLYQIVR